MSNDKGKLALSEKERERLKVLHEVLGGHILQREAAEKLGLSEQSARERVQHLLPGSHPDWTSRKYTHFVGRRRLDSGFAAARLTTKHARLCCRRSTD